MNQTEALAAMAELEETARHTPMQQAGELIGQLAGIVRAALTAPAAPADTTGTAG